MAAFLDRTVHVRAPATSANLGPGFDAVGLALELFDEVSARVTAGGLRIEVCGAESEAVVRDERHLVVRAMRETFAELGAQPAGLAVSCRNVVPHARGLGSSAAAIVAGVLAARALVADGAQRLDDAGALALAARVEGHPDNVAACLLGGLTIAWYDDDGYGDDRHDEEQYDDDERARAVRLEPAEGLLVAVLVPQTRSSTSASRGALPATVPHRDATHNAGRSALLAAALTTRPDLLLPATDDRLHQQYRRDGMGASAELLDRLRRNGVAAALSGSGPTVIAFGSAPAEVAGLAPAGFRVLPVGVDRLGATVR